VTGTFSARADPASENLMLSFDSSLKSRTPCTTARVSSCQLEVGFRAYAAIFAGQQCLVVAFPWPSVLEKLDPNDSLWLDFEDDNVAQKKPKN
jgi:hypothetical protein